MPDERPGMLCVLCRRRPVEAAWRPFCSERCKIQDLAHWADGAYRVPAEKVDDETVEDDAENAGLQPKKDSEP